MKAETIHAERIHALTRDPRAGNDPRCAWEGDLRVLTTDENRDEDGGVRDSLQYKLHATPRRSQTHNGSVEMNSDVEVSNVQAPASPLNTPGSSPVGVRYIVLQEAGVIRGRDVTDGIRSAYPKPERWGTRRVDNQCVYDEGLRTAALRDARSLFVGSPLGRTANGGCERAKRLADRRGTSVSKIVEHYFKPLLQEDAPDAFRRGSLLQ